MKALKIVGAVTLGLILIGIAFGDDAPEPTAAQSAPTATSSESSPSDSRAASVCRMVRQQVATGQTDASAIAREHGMGAAAVARIARGGCPSDWARHPSSIPTPRFPGERFNNAYLTFEDGSCLSEYGDYFRFAGTIANPTSRVMSYSITVGLFDAQGVRVGEGLANAQYVQPGETARWDAIGQYGGGDSGGRTCNIVNVEAFPQ